MNVDPDILRRFSEVMSNSAESMGAIDALTPFSRVEGALPGTAFQASCVTSAAAATAAVAALAARVNSIAHIARGVARDYAISEDEFTAELASMDAPR